MFVMRWRDITPNGLLRCDNLPVIVKWPILAGIVVIPPIAPGTTLTPVNERWLADEQTRQRMTGAIPMGRVANAEKVAEAILWLCSDAASFVTGVTLPVDGGSIVP